MGPSKDERDCNISRTLFKCSLLLVFVLHEAAAFSLTRWEVSLSQFKSGQTALRAVAAVTDDDEVATQRNNGEPFKSEPNNIQVSTVSAIETESSKLPPWLERHADRSQDEVEEDIRNLEYALLEHGYDIDDVCSIVNDICHVSSGDTTITSGIVQFLGIFLSLQDDEASKYFVTVATMRASILHFWDCVIAQRKGVPNLLTKFLRVPLGDRMCLPPADYSDKLALIRQPDDLVLLEKAISLSREEERDGEALWKEDDVEAIANGAARIKRAELLVQTILKNDRSKSSPEKIRDLLLAMMEDWRSLGIRVVACLYRLEGLIEASQKMNQYTERTPQTIQTAKQAMRIYAPLAQRLGLHSLKAKIEDRAFCLLYRRQYDVASALYHERAPVMHAVSSYLLSQISLSLRADPILMEQLDDFKITTRVKEPYSFWRKLLRKRLKSQFSSGDLSPRSLALTEVNDAVALRVIVKAKKTSPDESPESTRAREELLCHYVQQRIRGDWPETDPSRVKDYISQPKPNGYQSLHHTSKIFNGEIEFPFEVQVRSENMHKRAEYGVAAHWDYKLEGSKDSTETPKSLALPASDQSNTEEVNDYVKSLVQAKNSLVEHRVYVFIIGGEDTSEENGKLISVPVDSSIVDVIEEIETTVTSKVQVWRNGRLAALGDSLANGDVVVIAL